MRKIAIVNQKGGVAKTTTSISLAAGLSREHKRVLIIDLDPQGSIGLSLKNQSEKDVYDVLMENAQPKQCISNLGTNLDIMVSSEKLIKAEHELTRQDNSERLLLRKLEIVTEYDYIIVDCPPSFGLLTKMAILFCNEAIIPTSSDYFGVISLKKTIGLIEGINNLYDHDMQVTKIVPTLFDQRNKICKESHMQLKNEFYEIVTDPVRINSKVKEAPKFGKSIFSYKPKSPGAKDYMAVVRSVLQDESVQLQRNVGSQTVDIPA